MLKREELLLLVLYTSPDHQGQSPAVVGSTRLQKLVFLSTRESPLLSELCPEPYVFRAYDFGPYSYRLEQDVKRLSDIGWVEGAKDEEEDKEVEELSFEFLTDHIRRETPTRDIWVLKGPAIKQMADILEKIQAGGFDPALVLKEFRNQHAHFGSLSHDDLLRYVYRKYPTMSTKTKRRDLLPHWEEDEEGDEVDE